MEGLVGYSSNEEEEELDSEEDSEAEEEQAQAKKNKVVPALFRERTTISFAMQSSEAWPASSGTAVVFDGRQGEKESGGGVTLGVVVVVCYCFSWCS